MSKHFIEEDTQMANKHMKRCFPSYLTREVQIKTMRYHCITLRMAKIQNTGITKCWWGCGATGTLITAGGDVKWCSHFGR